MKKILSFWTMFCLMLSMLPAAQAGSGLGEIFERAQPTASTSLGEQFERGDVRRATEAPVTPQPTEGHASAEPTAVPTPEPPPPEPTPAPALFDEGVRDITCAAFGNRADYATIGGWTVNRGYLMEQEIYCLIGQGPDGARTALTDTLPPSFVPAGDSVIYYGKDENGKYNWVILEPKAGKPKRLSLGISDEVFYADADYIWYYTIVGEEISVRRLARKDASKKGFGRTTGSVVTMMEDGSALVADFHKNLVRSWKDSKGTTLYEPEVPILNVASAGRSIWVGHEREFGLLEDGKLGFRLPGQIVSMTGTTDQYVFLLSFPGSSAYDVVIFNDLYQAYARVGYVPASEDAFVELQPGGQMTVWGPEQSLIFDIPPAQEWIPYGYYDMESARAARGAPAPTAAAQAAPAPVEEPDWGNMVTITVPGRLASLTGEAEAAAQAEAAGISMTVNRDGSYTYFMTPGQHQAQLTQRGNEIRSALEGMVSTAPFNDALKSYTANDDFSEITFTVDTDRQEDSMAVLMLAVVGLVAPTYQAWEGKTDDPGTLIKLTDQSTGQIVATYTCPDDFLQ